MGRPEWFRHFFDASYVAALRESLPQWRRLLGRAGLRFLRAYGGYDGRAYRPGATGRLIVVAEK